MKGPFIETNRFEAKAKLSYCQNCKDMTETIITPDPRLFGMWPFNWKNRLCKDCGKLKRKSELEME